MTNGGEDTGAIDSGAPSLYTPEQLGRLRITLARSPYYCEFGYTLKFLFANSVVNQVVQIAIRFMDLEGTRKNILKNVGITADRAINQATIQIDEGLLFGVSCATIGIQNDVGTFYAQCSLYLTPDLTVPLVTLFSGFCTTNQPIAWPYAVTPVTLRPSSYAVIQGSTPAAGAQAIVTVPTGARWEIISVLGLFGCSVAVANRHVRLFYTIGTLTVIQAINTFLQTAGQLGTYIAGSPWPAQNMAYGIVQYTTLPTPTPLVMQGGDTINTAVDAIQAADTWTGLIVLYREELRIQ